MTETAKITVPPAVIINEARAEIEFWRSRSITNATLRDRAEQELQAVTKDRDKLMQEISTMHVAAQENIKIGHKKKGKANE